MERNAKIKKYAGSCSICNLSVTDFLTKAVSIGNRFGRSSKGERSPLSLVSPGMKGNCKKLPLRSVHSQHFGCIMTRNPNVKFEREGFLNKFLT